MTSEDHNSPWTRSARDTVASYRRMIDACAEQLTDSELFARPEQNINSVATLLRHLGGNLQSRWSNFLTTDGEKKSRNRDLEFTDWDGDRNSLLAYFDCGWQCLVATLDEIESIDPNQTVTIRGETHTIADAVWRSVTHVSYHVGQIALISRLVHQGDWQWLTIAPNASSEHNQTTWGLSVSRSVFADPNDV